MTHVLFCNEFICRLTVIQFVTSIQYPEDAAQQVGYKHGIGVIFFFVAQSSVPGTSKSLFF
jgi:hypothetical protein